METCLPLELVKLIDANYPGIWDKLEEIHKKNVDGELWDKKCYIPMPLVYDELCKMDSNKQRCLLYASATVGIAAWRIHKQIFEFDKDLEQMLLEQKDEDLILPVEVINNLPFRCIYIKTKALLDSEGFFVYFDDYNGQVELRFLIVKPDENLGIVGMTPSLINMTPGKTINELIDSLIQEEFKLSKLGLGDISDQSEEVHESISVMLQFVLYLCSQNKEVIEDPVQKKVTKQPKDFKFIKDKYREVQKWNCGTNTGNAIREYRRNPTRYEYEKDPERIGTGTPKRPHSRRGHWHSFWVGKKGTSERKTVLKWVAPTFVHKMIEQEESNGITTNIVKNNSKHS